MATRTIANGGGNWNAVGTWVEGAVPGLGDDVVATGTSGNLVINATANCHSMDLTGYVGTLTCSGTRTLTIGGGATDTTAAVFKLATGMTFTGGGTFTIVLDNRSGGITVTSNGITMNGVTNFNTGSNASSVGATFADSLNVGSANCAHQRGTWSLTSGTSMTAGGFDITGAGTRTLSWAGATINLSGSFTQSTNTLTNTDNSSSVLNMTGSGVTFSLATATTFAGTVNMTGATTATIAGTAPTFKNFNRTGTASLTCELVLSTNFTMSASGALTLKGNAANQRLVVRSDTLGTARSITIPGTVTQTIQDSSYRDITAVTTAISGTRVGDMGGNTNVTTTTPKTVYWVGGTGNWSDSTNHWAASSGGSAGVTNYPLAQDTGTFDTNSFSANGQSVTFDVAHIANIDASLATNRTWSMTTSVTTNLYGNVTLSSTQSLAAANPINTLKRGTQTFTSNGVSISASASCPLTLLNIGGTLQPQDNFVYDTTDTTSNIVITNGTLNPLGNLTASSVTNSGSATRGFTGTNTKTLTIRGAGLTTIALTTGTGMATTGNSMNISFTSSSATDKFIFLDNNTTWGTITVTPSTGVSIFNAAMTCSGLASSGAGAHTVRFGAGATITINTPTFFSGTSGALVTIESGIGGSAFTLSCASQVSVDYISLKDSTASGGTPFYAGANSTNVSGNTNWTFTAPPSGGGGKSSLLLMGV